MGLKSVTDPSEAADFGEPVKAQVPSNQAPVSKGAAAFSGHSDARRQTPVRQGIVPEGVVTQIDDDWWDGEGRIYLLWAILNPNGPTLYAIGHKKVPGGLRVYFRWMHMLGGKTTFAAQTRSSVSRDGLQQDLNEISAHLAEVDEPQPFHTIPNVMIPSGGDRELANLGLHMITSGDAAKEDWGRFMAYQRQFGADFFGLAVAQLSRPEG
jgi:hypothetical protein